MLTVKLILNFSGTIVVFFVFFLPPKKSELGAKGLSPRRSPSNSSQTLRERRSSQLTIDAGFFFFCAN